MTSRDYRDIIGGVALVALGLFFALYATENYKMGTIAKMGPGMFPTALGYLLAALGILVMVPAFFRSGERMSFHLRPFLACSAGILAFAIVIRHFGMVPAVVALVICSAMADTKLKAKGIAILAAVATLIAVLVFTYAFEMPVPWFRMGGY